MLSEINQSQKYKPHGPIYIWNLKSNSQKHSRKVKPGIVCWDRKWGEGGQRVQSFKLLRTKKFWRPNEQHGTIINNNILYACKLLRL
jgi:hypothetical protein